MKIDINNYEAFLLDYIEGNLSAEDAAELMLFLEANPALQVDLEGIQDIIVTPDEILPRTGLFEHLKKPETIDLAQFDELAVKVLEGEATQIEVEQLNEVVAAIPSFEKAWKAFQLTKLKAPTIVLENKADFYRSMVPQKSFDELAVASLEGEITASEQVQLDLLIASSEENQKQWAAFQLTKLKASSEVFENKDSLYRKAGGRLVPMWFRAAAAASVAAFVGLFFLLNSNNEVDPGLASKMPDTTGVVRPSTVNDKPNSKFEYQDIVQPEPALQPMANERSISVPRTNVSPDLQRVQQPDFAGLANKRISIEQPFQLNTEYMAMQPEDLLLQQNLSTAFNYEGEISSEEISRGSLILKRVRKFLKRQDIAIEEPLEEIRRDGFTESSFKGLERVTNGSIRVEREKTEKGNRVTGFSIGGLSYSRSGQK
jgi:hypothetical protein